MSTCSVSTATFAASKIEADLCIDPEVWTKPKENNTFQPFSKLNRLRNCSNWWNVVCCFASPHSPEYTTHICKTNRFAQVHLSHSGPNCCKMWQNNKIWGTQFHNTEVLCTTENSYYDRLQLRFTILTKTSSKGLCENSQKYRDFRDRVLEAIGSQNKCHQRV